MCCQIKKLFPKGTKKARRETNGGQKEKHMALLYIINR